MDFIVIFIRNDDKPIEEYYYNTLDQAKEHFNLFLNDDSGLYSAIQICKYNGEVLAEQHFDNQEG